MAKKKAKKAGRPPLPDDERLGSPSPVRFKDDERSLIERASESTGLAFSAFVRHAAVEKARRVLGES